MCIRVCVFFAFINTFVRTLYCVVLCRRLCCSSIVLHWYLYCIAFVFVLYRIVLFFIALRVSRICSRVCICLVLYCTVLYCIAKVLHQYLHCVCICLAFAMYCIVLYCFVFVLFVYGIPICVSICSVFYFVCIPFLLYLCCFLLDFIIMHTIAFHCNSVLYSNCMFLYMY